MPPNLSAFEKDWKATEFFPSHNWGGYSCCSLFLNSTPDKESIPDLSRVHVASDLDTTLQVGTPNSRRGSSPASSSPTTSSAKRFTRCWMASRRSAAPIEDKAATSSPRRSCHQKVMQCVFFVPPLVSTIYRFLYFSTFRNAWSPSPLPSVFLAASASRSWRNDGVPASSPKDAGNHAMLRCCHAAGC